MSVTAWFPTVPKPSPQQVSVNIHGDGKSYLGALYPAIIHSNWEAGEPHFLLTPPCAGPAPGEAVTTPFLSWVDVWVGLWPLVQWPSQPHHKAAPLWPLEQAFWDQTGCPKVSRNLLIVRVQQILVGSLGERRIDPSEYKIKGWYLSNSMNLISNDVPLRRAPTEECTAWPRLLRWVLLYPYHIGDKGRALGFEKLFF